MNATQFNEKWEAYLEDRHYGMSLCSEEAIDYLDKEFEKEIEINPNFSYSQIKTKFNDVRIYANSDNVDEWERQVKLIIG